MRNTYQITEYGSFVAEKQIEGFVSLPQHTFDALESFVLTNRSKETDALELLGLSAKKGIGRVIILCLPTPQADLWRDRLSHER